MPPSLHNIFKELKSDLGIARTSTDLTDWAKQGVLLLNSIMTVVKDTPLSHKNKGWETFTDRVISELNRKDTPIVFLLWGANAERKARIIQTPPHHKLITVHPSPLSAYRGFFGCKHFSKANRILEESGQQPIQWNGI